MSGAVVLGGGLVGAAAANALSAAGWDVVVMDLVTHPVLADRDEVAADAVRAAVSAVSAVALINAAGRLTGTEAELTDANDHWPRWLVEEVIGPGELRLVHVGSAAEYGDPGSAAPVGEDVPARPSGAYGESKWAGTRAVLGARSAGADAVVARPFNIVASPPAPSSPLQQFLHDVAALGPDGGEVSLWWPATTRDYVMIEDVGMALAALADPHRVPDVPPLVNVCTGVPLRFDDIVVALAARRGVPVRVVSLERPGIPAVVGDPSLLGRLTGMRPTMTADRLAERLWTALDPPPASP